MSKLIIGVHAKKDSDTNEYRYDTLYDSILGHIKENCINCVQIFTHGPRSNYANKLSLVEIKQIADRKGIPIYIHSQYPFVSVWNDVDDKLDIFKDMCERAEAIIAEGIVVHIIDTPEKEAAEVMRKLLPIANEYSQVIYLEMTAKRSSAMTYDTALRINALSKILLDMEYSENWAWCIDTAHIWCAGNDVVRNYDSMKSFLESITPNTIGMFHLNGCSTELGAGKDTHEIAFTEDDLIWGGMSMQDSGYRAVVEYAVTHSIPIILEINRGSYSDVSKLISKTKKASKLIKC